MSAMERREAAPTAEPPIDHMAIERKITQDDVGRFEMMLREDPAKYWRSPEMQQRFREAIGRATPETLADGEPPEVTPADPGQTTPPGPADGGAVRV
jgi:hypothetical protein